MRDLLQGWDLALGLVMQSVSDYHFCISRWAPSQQSWKLWREDGCELGRLRFRWNLEGQTKSCLYLIPSALMTQGLTCRISWHLCHTASRIPGPGFREGRVSGGSPASTPHQLREPAHQSQRAWVSTRAVPQPSERNKVTIELHFGLSNPMQISLVASLNLEPGREFWKHSFSLAKWT